MSEPLTIVIPGDPKGKERPRFGRGRAYTAEGTRAYEEQVGWLAKQELRGRPPIMIPVVMHLRAHFAIPKGWPLTKRQAALIGLIRPTCGPDIDNIVKAVADGLNHIAYRDDKQIVSVNASKVYGASPMVVVTIKEITGSEVSEAQSLEVA